MRSSFKINLGSAADGQAVVLDSGALLETRMLVCSNSGGGKSHLLRLFAEQAAARVPTLILDHEGEYATLRPHVDAVLVGPEGDVPTSLATADRLAHKLAELRVSAVIDLYELRLEEKRRFVRIFLDALLSLPRKLWGPTFVVVDEAHKFAPESDRDAESRASIIALMDQGRKRGIGALLATQRLSKLAKDASAEASNLLIGRLTQDLDQRRASDLLGFAGKSEWATLRDFEAGQFFAVGPAFAHRGVASLRTGRTQTAPPARGQQYPTELPRPSGAIVRVTRELAEIQKRAEAEQGPVVRPSDAASVDREELRRAVDRAHAEGVEVGRRSILEVLGPAAHAAADSVSSVVRLADAFVRRSEAPSPRTAKAPAVAKAPKTTPRSEETAPSTLSGAPLRLLTVLLQASGPLPRNRAALHAGLSPRSSTFRNAMSRLRTGGLVEDVAGGFSPTARARELHGASVRPLPTGAALLDHWRTQLGEGAPAKLYDALVRARRPVPREQAATLAGLSPTSSTFRNAMSRLRGLGLVVMVGSDLGLAPELGGSDA